MKSNCKHLSLLAAAVALTVLTPASRAGIEGDVTVQERHTDNLYNRPGTFNPNRYAFPGVSPNVKKGEVDSWLSIVRPIVQANFDHGANHYSVIASAESGSYSASHADDYEDYALKAIAALELDVRNHVKAEASHEHLHDRRGTSRTDNPEALANSFSPDEFDKDNVNIVYTLGAPTARAKVDFTVGATGIDYTNNRTYTKVFDRNEQRYAVLGYLKVLPKTYALLETRESDISYEEQSLRRDSTERKHLVGVKWDATKKTTGTFKMGYQTKDWENNLLHDFESVAWEADVTWKPRSYSTVTVSSARLFDENTGTESSVDRTETLVNWQHDWSSSLASNIFYRQIGDDSINTHRYDKVNEIGVGAAYRMRPWLVLGAQYSYQQRNTHYPTFSGLVYDDRRDGSRIYDYDKNVFTLSAEVKFK